MHQKGVCRKGNFLHFARLSKVVFLGAPVRKGYVERELFSLHLRERGVVIQGSLCSPLKSGGFLGTFGCTGKGYVERELLSLCSRERVVLILSSLCSPLKSGFSLRFISKCNVI